MKIFCSILLVAVMLSGCSNYVLVPPERVTVDNMYSLQPTIAWNKATKGKAEIWTIDGRILQELYFINGLDDGDKLFSSIKQSVNEKMPTFKEGMTALDIKDIFVSGAALLGVTNVKAQNIRPFNFGRHTGFRFELEYTLSSGLEKRGFAVGAVLEEKLYLIAFTATRIHFFDAYKDEAERIVNSIRLIKAAKISALNSQLTQD